MSKLSTPNEKLEFLRSTEGATLQVQNIKGLFSGVVEIPNFLTPAFSQLLNNSWPAINKQLQKTIGAEAKTELEAKLLAAEDLVDDIKKQLKDIKDGNKQP